MPINPAYPAIFIDRDGVIIENCADYVRSWEDVAIFPQALQALAFASSSPYKIVLVTNQAAIAKGLITLEEALEINERLLGIIRKNSGRIDGIYMCPHQASDRCQCRKPRPGLLFQARDELSIDLSRSIMIGDALSDLRAGRAAGIRTNILLLTGRGKEQTQLPEAADLQPFLIYADLNEAFSSFFKA
jgi:D-glycero-D-manno-heptose 1,7-bisphosphate phosphatase